MTKFIELKEGDRFRFLMVGFRQGTLRVNSVTKVTRTTVTESMSDGFMATQEKSWTVVHCTNLDTGDYIKFKIKDPGRIIGRVEKERRFILVNDPDLVLL